jgi:hypothetical protein
LGKTRNLCQPRPHGIPSIGMSQAAYLQLDNVNSIEWIVASRFLMPIKHLFLATFF